MKRRAVCWLTSACCVAVLMLTRTTAIADEASEILNTAGVKGGLIVHVGCGDGKLTAALHANASYIVHGLDTDAKNIVAARQHIQSLGLYGTVSVERWEGKRLPYVDNLVSLVVAERLDGVAMNEVLRVLAPNGVALIGGRKTVKPWPGEIDEWTHALHGPDNNPVAQDTVIGPPRRLQWCCESLWLRSHGLVSSLSAMVSAKGRLFYIFDEGPTSMAGQNIPERWMLTARDAFNGVLLWKRPLSNWGTRVWGLQGLGNPLRNTPHTVPHCLIAEGDRVFVTLGYKAVVSALDAATGQTLTTFTETEGATELRCADGLLLVIKNENGLAVFAAATGKQRWKISDKIQPLVLAAQDGGVYYETEKMVMCCAIADGKELWRVPHKTPIRTIIPHQDRVLVVGDNDVQALSAKTGEKLWTSDSSSRRGEVFVTGGLLWINDGKAEWEGLDLLTGKTKQRVDPTAIYSAGHHFRCYPPKCTEHFLITNNRGAEFVNLTGGEHTQNDWIRGSCTFGVLPCNGMLYVPPTPCFCYPGAKLQGFNALAPAPVVTSLEDEASPAGRLQRGPAYENISNRKIQISDAADWPTYRHDAARTGAATSEVPPQAAMRWRVQLRGRLTPPVVSDGRVVVVARDEYTVHAFGSDDGRKLWQFTAGGPVDSPPSLLGNLVLFGCADGYAYCLRATDGQLVWRFRAAPVDRRIVAYGQLESPWRVHGSILIQDGVAYLTAGRSSFLDGGIWIYGLQPESGRILYQTRLDTWNRTREDAKGKPFFPAFHIEGALSDVLVGQGDSIYLGQYQFDRKLARRDAPYVMPVKNPNAVVINPETGEVGGKGKRNPFLNFMNRSHPGLADQYEKAFGGITFGKRHMDQRHLMTTSGFLNGSWFNRTFWTYASDWPGWTLTEVSNKTGQLLVIGSKQTYVLQAYPGNSGNMTFKPGDRGYLLFAAPNDKELEPGKAPRGVKRADLAETKLATWFDWVPIRIQGMVLASQTLFVAGPPDKINPGDPMATFEGRQGGVLRAYSAADGKLLVEQKLEASPVLDGLIAARGKLLMSMTDGTVVCFGTPR